jgi:F420-dependent oxidoreductase-like protein
MVEGQMGLNWPRWMRLARAVEDLGFAALHRSDHFTNPNPPDEDSLELFVSLTWLASNTSRIEFGPLVTPVSFRHPAFIARMGSAIDDLSGGRLVLGVGAGWQDREHHDYSFQLLSVSERLARFEEALQVLTGMLKTDDPVTFEGQYYQFHNALILPRPSRPGGPRLLIGGNGKTRTLPFVARFAEEWNGVYLRPEAFAERSALLDDLLREQGRSPESVRRSLMVGLIFGRDDAALRRKLDGRSADERREQGIVVGTPSEVVDQVGKLAEVGVQRLMLQWLDLDDMDGLEALAQAVL